MSVENQEALDKAMEELDDLEKSVKEEPKDELDELTKSLEEELGDELTKSHKEPDGDEDDKGAEPVGQEEEDGEGDLDKSAQDDNYDEELVKASEAFASLEKSVQEMTTGLAGEVDSLKKSVAALLNLNIKQAKVIASLAKSRHDDMERIEKSVSELGAKPLSPGQAKFGIGGVEVVEELTKSISEISESLTKAVQAGQVDARHLSIFGTYKDVGRLPEDVKKIIGL